MAALFGGLPLAMGKGTGSELRHPLGITIVGGLIDFFAERSVQVMILSEYGITPVDTLVVPTAAA